MKHSHYFMKIAIITIYPPKGQKHSKTSGVASYTKNLLEHIPLKPSDEVVVLCDKLDGKQDAYNESNIKVVRCFDRKPVFILQLLREIKNQKPDVIHIQQEIALFGNVFTAYLLQWLMFSLKKQRVIITLHGVVALDAITPEFVRGNNSTLSTFLVKLAFRIIFTPIVRYASHIIVHENTFRDILISDYKADRNKISVINHGVESFTPATKEDACKKLSLDPKKDIVLFMGYLTGYKGIDLLIEGFSLYTKTNPNAFLIIGAGKHPKLENDSKYLQEYERLITKAKELIPENQYIWNGFIPELDITSYYSAADVSVYPYTDSISSSGPMAIAIGHGKPFFASDVFSGAFPDESVLFAQTAGALNAKFETFFKDPTNIREFVLTQKQKRSWGVCGEQTRFVYNINQA